MSTSDTPTSKATSSKTAAPQAGASPVTTADATPTGGAAAGAVAVEERPPALAALADELRELAVLKSISSVLGWDEQVNLRPQGAEHRAEQLALMAGLSHGRATDGKLADLIAAAEAVELPANSPGAAVVRDARRDFDRATKLPRRLVEDLSRTTLMAQQAWVKARRGADFTIFEPHLRRVVLLKQEEADAVGSPSGDRYDALLDDYEPGMTAAQVDGIFGPLAESLSELVASLDERPSPSTAVMERDYSIRAQRALCRGAAEAIGFAFNAGRLDEAAHPFCSGFGPGDCRLTTRYSRNLLSQGLYGTLHEAGHGLYEQGLPPEHYGTALGEACSLGVHESQSRLWENFVGRTPEFWEFLTPLVRRLFPVASRGVGADDYHRAANVLRRSFIRVESDELTYNLHIVLRYELERELIDSRLDPADVPERWNARFEELIGLKVPTAAKGCLQDVHWSAGLIGYFPTYALGNLYAAQLMETVRETLPQLDTDIAAGRFEPLLMWLREHIHTHGRRLPAPELITQATGREPTAEPLLRYLTAKVEALGTLA